MSETTVRTPSAREHIAWLFWCIDEGYVNAADRAGMTNWLAEDPAALHPDDAAEREHLLAMADEVLAGMVDSAAESHTYSRCGHSVPYEDMEPTCPICATRGTDPEVLDSFEIGYDRQYTGAALHCRLCPPDRFGTHWVDDEYIEDWSLAQVVDLAEEHMRIHHPAADPSGVDS